MTHEQAYALIVKALQQAVPGASLDGLRPEVHLVKDGIIDSLDSMAFLYELEKLCGDIDEIGEDFNDFRVARLTEIVQRL